jgi:NAD(P)-dependent dehydrogenase (short-subunit alcohol dehydrogenase family)
MQTNIEGAMNAQTKLAVVTGGASGIGEATAERLGLAGYRIVIADMNEGRARDVVQRLRSTGYEAHFYCVDISSEEQTRRFSESVLSEHGVPDALINSGGILQNAVRLLEMEISEFDRISEVNLRGTLITSRAFGAAMCSARQGSIINLCSLTTFRPSAQIGYAVSKAGLKMLTEVMAAEWGPSGVRVNAVAPGYTLTPAMQSRIDAGERDPSVVIGKSALRRFVQPAEVANTIAFLCSPDASAITGVTLPIDCGWLVTSAYAAYAAQPV